jgi:hypothetical protein
MSTSSVRNLQVCEQRHLRRMLHYRVGIPRISDRCGLYVTHKLCRTVSWSQPSDRECRRDALCWWPVGLVHGTISRSLGAAADPAAATIQLCDGIDAARGPNDGRSAVEVQAHQAKSVPLHVCAARRGNHCCLCGGLNTCHSAEHAPTRCLVH